MACGGVVLAFLCACLLGCLPGGGGSQTSNGGLPLPSGVQSLPTSGRLTVVVYVDDAQTPAYSAEVAAGSQTVQIQVSATQGEHAFTVVFDYEDPDFVRSDGQPWEVARWTSGTVQVASGQDIPLTVSEYAYADSNGDGQSNLDQLIARTDPGAPPETNQAPVAQNGTLTVDQDKTGLGTLAATDADSDPLTFSLIAQPAHGAAVLTNAATGAYTYRPDAGFSGSDSFSFKANDGDKDSNTATVSITVRAVAIPVHPIPGKIEAEDYNPGGQNVGYFDTTSGNRGGDYRDDDVDIEASSDAGGGYDVGWIEKGEWLKYNVEVQTTGQYAISLRTSRDPNGSSTMHVEMDGTDITGLISIPSTRSWQRFTTVVIDGVGLTAGAHVLRLFFDGKDFNLNWIAFTPVDGGGTTLEDPAGIWRSADTGRDDFAILQGGRLAMRSSGVTYTGMYAGDSSHETYAGTLDIYDAGGDKLNHDPVPFTALRQGAALTLTLGGSAPAPNIFELVYDTVYDDGADLSRTAEIWTKIEGDYVLIFTISSAGQIDGATDSNGCGYHGSLSVSDASHDAYTVSMSLDNGCGDLAGDNYTGYAALDADHGAMTLIVSNGVHAVILDLLAASL